MTDSHYSYTLGNNYTSLCVGLTDYLFAKPRKIMRTESCELSFNLVSVGRETAVKELKDEVNLPENLSLH